MIDLKDEIDIIMPSCDKYIHLLRGNVFLIEHFWKDHPKIHIIGFKEPEYGIDFPNDRWKFHSMGKDMGKNSWGNDLIKFFDEKGEVLKGDYFIHMNDDAPPLKYVEDDRIKYMFDYMKNDPKIGRTAISGGVGFVPNKPNVNKRYDKLKNHKYPMAEAKSDINYRTSIGNDIWKKEYFLKYLKPDISSWGYETLHPKNDGYRVITTPNEPPIVYCHLYRSSGLFDPNWYKSKGFGLELEPSLKKKYIKLTGLDKMKHKLFK